jgi:tetratricopeptide (TPR) repeat protein
MLSKIEIYREVLEIEPNSKVFFPLARSLAEQGRHDEAAAVLSRGIGFHPDHLEAKFLLIEILTRQGREEKAEQVFADVGSLLARYPSVWLLWSKTAAARAKDPSLAMLFLAHYFQNQTLTWADVMERGLQSLSQAAATPEAMAAPGVEQDGREAPGRVAPTAPAPSEAVAPPSPALAEAVVPHAPSPAQAVVPPAPAASFAAPDAGPAVAACPPQAGRMPAPEVRSGLGVFDALVDAAQEQAASTLAEDEPEAARMLPPDEASGGPQLRGAREVMALADILESPEVAPEPRSRTRAAKGREQGVCTRTMAQLLAEQGDAAGALAIYRELFAAASATEREELSALMAALTPHPADEDVSAGPLADTPATDKAVPGQPKASARLADFLEALAGRLEARAGS